MVVFLLALAIMPQTTETFSQPVWNVTGSKEQGFSFDVAPFPQNRTVDVETMLNVEAAKQCTPLITRLGSYSARSVTMTINGRTVPGFINYHRTIGCVQQEISSSPEITSFSPIPRDENDAHSVFDRYFDAIDHNDIDSALAITDKGPWTREQSLEASKSFDSNIGRGKRIVYSLKWKMNPPDQPHSGVYVDIFYYGRFSRGKTVCGAALFYRQGTGAYLFSRNLMQVGETIDLPKSGNPCPSDASGNN